MNTNTSQIYEIPIETEFDDNIDIESDDESETDD
jgi:hypothetical protein